MKAKKVEVESLRELDVAELASVHGGAVLEKILPGDEFFRASVYIDERLRTREKWMEDWADHIEHW